MSNLPIASIQQSVLTWYRKYGRHDLPWRNLEPLHINIPYGVMVAEFMLQQTQVERVIPKYLAFLEFFPTLESIAQAAPAQVIQLWSGLGYNRRAVLLQKAAQTILTEYAGTIPDTASQLKTLPGFGDYTAAAVAAFGFNQSVPLLDTNIIRFYELLMWGYTRPSHKIMVDRAAQFIPPGQSRAWHSALMDLMTVIRKFKQPQEQQKELVRLLNLDPSWPLPELGEVALERPKQSHFLTSRRFFRGQIIRYLTQQADHRANYEDIKTLLQELEMPYDLKEILHDLKRDHLLIFAEPLDSKTVIALP